MAKEKVYKRSYFTRITPENERYAKSSRLIEGCKVVDAVAQWKTEQLQQPKVWHKVAATDKSGAPATDVPLWFSKVNLVRAVAYLAKKTNGQSNYRLADKMGMNPVMLRRYYTGQTSAIAMGFERWLQFCALAGLSRPVAILLWAWQSIPDEYAEWRTMLGVTGTHGKRRRRKYTLPEYDEKWFADIDLLFDVIASCHEKWVMTYTKPRVARPDLKRGA